MTVCWGCNLNVPRGASDYCESCQVSIKLIQHMQEDGTVVLWNLPEEGPHVLDGTIGLQHDAARVPGTVREVAG
ncbi:MAG TPA: hypothetical protein VFE98_11005 [Candidatus Bathyarchaeia archaeon]|nr:hypothetical protein [Candidatus Bathyarchaeia archaeon]